MANINTTFVTETSEEETENCIDGGEDDEDDLDSDISINTGSDTDNECRSKEFSDSETKQHLQLRMKANNVLSPSQSLCSSTRINFKSKRTTTRHKKEARSLLKGKLKEPAPGHLKTQTFTSAATRILEKSKRCQKNKWVNNNRTVQANSSSFGKR